MFGALSRPERAFPELDRLRRELDSFFPGNFFAAPYFAQGGAAYDTSVRGTYRDQGEALVFHFAVPGFTQADVKVEVTRDNLSIQGEKAVETPEGVKVHRRERASVKFQRSWTLPSPVDPEQASAVVKNGVLTVTLPKVPEVRPRAIPVQSVQ